MHAQVEAALHHKLAHLHVETQSKPVMKHVIMDMGKSLISPLFPPNSNCICY